MNLAKIAEVLQEKNNFLLVGHVDPDWDCVGSVLALQHILESLGKDVQACLPDPPPDNYPDIRGLDGMLVLDGRNQNYQPEGDFVLVGIDSSDPERFGRAARLIDEALMVVNIDHHEDNPLFGDLNCVRPEMASAGMIIYELARELGIRQDVEFARMIASSVIGDTGGFKHSNTGRPVFSLLLELMEAGLELHPLVREFHTISRPQLKLRGYAFKNLKFFGQDRIAVMTISREEFAMAGARAEDSKNIVGYARDLKGVEVGIFIWEDEDYYQVSLRSKNRVPVNKVAADFLGGGHPRAAGCRVPIIIEGTGRRRSLAEVTSMLADAIIPYLD